MALYVPKIKGETYTRLGISAVVVDVENIGDDDADYITVTIEAQGKQGNGGGRETNRALNEAFANLKQNLGLLS